MTEIGIWEVAKTIVGWMVIPLSGLLAFVMRDYKKHQQRLDNVEKRLAHTEMLVKVIEVKLDDVKDDIKEIKMIISKIFDMLQEKR